MKKQRKLLKWIALLLCLMPWGLVRAATETTVYYAVPADVVGTYTVKLNVNYIGDGDDWNTSAMTMTLEDKTYFGNRLYKCTFKDKYDGLGVMQFQLYNGDTWVSQKYGIGHDDGYGNAVREWTSVGNYNGKIYDHNENTWFSYNYDKTVTIHCLKKDGWSSVYVHNYFNNGISDVSETEYPGNAAVQDALNEQWYDYTITGIPCTSLIFNNGNSGEGNQSDVVAIGDESEYWVTYDGTSTTIASTAPSPWYIRDLGVSFEYNVHDWATYVSDVDLALPANVTAYTVSGVSGNTVTATSIGYIPANVPVLLNYSTGSSYGAISTTKAEAYTGTTDEFTSLLQGSAATTTPLPSAGGYILYNNKLVWCEGTSVAAQRCYLPASVVGSSGARELQIVTEGSEATGIREKVAVDSEKTAAAPVYNLAGQRVSQPTRGLYIVNGKKVVMK